MADTNVRPVQKSPLLPSFVLANQCDSSVALLALFGDQGAGKTSTSGTLTPGRETCVILTQPRSQMKPHHPDVRILDCQEFKKAIYALEYPDKLIDAYKWSDMKTLVLDDATSLVEIGLQGEGIRRANDRRQPYGTIRFEVEGALQKTIAKAQSIGFNFILIAQARKLENEASQVKEITIDVPPSLENLILSKMDYVFFVKKPLQKGKPPTLVTRTAASIVTKLRLTRQQINNPPVQDEEPADLKVLWNKLSKKENK